jgi:RimJ/RimL family protein N-acetyltransferase
VDVEHYAAHFRAFIALMLEVAFDDLDFHRVHTETYDIRPLHVATLEDAGFLREGTMRDHVLIGRQFRNSQIHGIIKGNRHAGR